ncbi:glycosyltransferase family 4 protein [Waterburya agarophytonicola K14]|uniref:Glycosyltransferase family 4 protein n=1 Tax=Waterburya agarophytonicola KI4 TaxID=2874699 RepID=A0A964FGR3_9CYAN|nr:glycosyltransferase family 4 protein [Waterburya agarophytonicola]MCC0179215.1 glycosyltransferase family 4 protein [Waterburya agarophytonicola KI4]
MNILFVITRADAIGGAQVHVKDLAIALQKDRHKVLILTGQQGVFNEDLREAGIESIPCEFLRKQINPFLDGKSLRYILHIISEFRPDLIAAHSSKTGILGRLASKMSQIPCVFTAHGWSFTTGIPQPNRTIYRVLEKATAFLADKIICVSEHDRSIGIKAGMDSAKLLTVHNGMKDITPNLMANPVGGQPIKVAMIARFDRQKDHATLIEAFQDLNAELILIGDGPSMLKTQKQVEKLNMAKKVQFLGFRQDIAQILAEVQIFTLISNWEGLPCTIIEAMRAGLPVVASDVGGVKEIVIDSQTGYVIPRGDAIALHQKLAYLIENESARTSMGILARQKYESELTFKHMYERTLAVYEQVVADRANAIAIK